MFVEDDWGCDDIIHSIVLCVCVRADCGHDNDDDECFHFALDCFGRWETPVDDDTWYFYWFFISCAVIILNCVNQWMQWVHCAVINHKIWNVLWNTSLFLYCSEWNVTREVNNVEWSEWHKYHGSVPSHATLASDYYYHYTLPQLSDCRWESWCLRPAPARPPPPDMVGSPETEVGVNKVHQIFHQ